MPTDIPITLIPNREMEPGTAVVVSWTKEYMERVSELAVQQMCGVITPGEATRQLGEIAQQMAQEKRVVGLKNIGEPNGTKTETPQAERAEGQNQ